MEFLRKYIKNEPLLNLIEKLIGTFEAGLSIGSYLSQYLCNVFLSQIYHEIAEKNVSDQEEKGRDHTTNKSGITSDILHGRYINFRKQREGHS